MAENKKSSWTGVFIGPVLVVVGILALWKNEGRFDYYQAAKHSEVISSIGPEHNGKIICYTESMDTELTLPGDYVESLVGYLTVSRSAQIYAWDRDEDDEGHVSWNLKWMGRVQNNNRNQGLSQQLKSHLLRPEEYRLGDLSITEDSIEFVDVHQDIPVSSLKLTKLANEKNLQVRGNHFHLSKQASDQLGDERISYQGIPVPSTGTYFGKLEQGQGVVHQAVVKDGIIDSLIGDKGIVHYLVTGERNAALSTMKSHITRLKWMVRGGGFLGITFGFMIFFSVFAGFLYHIPVIGGFAQWGVFAISLALGVIISIVTIVSSYLFNHPLVVLIMLAAGGILFYLARKRATESQQRIKQSLAQELGHSVNQEELEELEFIELVQLALIDKKIEAEEKKFILKWAKRHHWSKDKVKKMVVKAKNSAGDVTDSAYSAKHLKNLIRLALADGHLSSFELRTISKVANEVGYKKSDIKKFVDQVRFENSIVL